MPHPGLPPSILVTGATGNLGRHVVERLLARDVAVRSLARRPAPPRAGVDPVVGDLSRPDGLRAALAGVDAVLLVWPVLEPGRAHAVVEELLAAQVPRTVYLSSTAVADDRARQSDPIAQVHSDMEALLHDDGLQPVVLRSDTLASNARGWAAQVRAGDEVAGPDVAPTAVVDERDVAGAVVTALLGSPRGDTPYLLTGPEPLTRAEQVARLGTALGRDLRFRPLAADRARARMLADGLPRDLVDALVAAALHRPASTRLTADVERLTGRPARAFATWAADHADEFRV